jgi:hypothetical protein
VLYFELLLGPKQAKIFGGWGESAADAAVA